VFMRFENKSCIIKTVKYMYDLNVSLLDFVRPTLKLGSYCVFLQKTVHESYDIIFRFCGVFISLVCV